MDIVIIHITVCNVHINAQYVRLFFYAVLSCYLLLAQVLINIYTTYVQ